MSSNTESPESDAKLERLLEAAARATRDVREGPPIMRSGRYFPLGPGAAPPDEPVVSESPAEASHASRDDEPHER